MASFFCWMTGSGNMCTSKWLLLAGSPRATHYADGMVNAPKIPPMPRRIKNPNLLVVTKDVTIDATPSMAKPSSNMTDAGNKSLSRPAKRRNAAKQIEYDVMIWSQV